MPESRPWYLDSSVALRILLGHSQAAIDWYDSRAAAGDAFVSSRLLHLEMVRVLRREVLDVGQADEFVAELTLLHVDNALVREAAAIQPHVRSLDSLHLASALRVGAGNIGLVTHDSAMASVARGLGFHVYDPVTD